MILRTIEPRLFEELENMPCRGVIGASAGGKEYLSP